MGQIVRRVATVELADGSVHEGLRIIWADTAAYQRTAEKHGWPHMTVKDGVGTVPHLNREEPFTVWAALKRLGLYAGKWEEFEDRDCVGFVLEVEPVDPTPAAGEQPAADDSASKSPVNIRGSRSTG